MKIVTAQSGEYPVLLDKTSSRTTVYKRTNIQEKTREEETETHTYYEYTERQYTQKEWREIETDTKLLDQDFRLTKLELGV